MREIIDFRVTLIRKQFHIYGFSNIAMCMLLLSIILIVPRLLLSKIMIKSEMILVIGIVIYMIASELISRNISDDEINTINCFFKNINISKYKKYTIIKNLLIYEFIILYVMFPYSKSTLKDSLAVIAGIEFITFITYTLKITRGKSVVDTFKTIVVLICLSVSILNRKLNLGISIKMNNYVSGIVLTISMILITMIVPCHVESTKNKNTIQYKRKYSNKDYAFYFRRKKYLELAAVNVLSFFLAYGSKEKGLDLIFECVFTSIYIVMQCFIFFIQYEKNTYVLIYKKENFSRLIIEKIIHASVLSLPYLILNGFLYTFASANYMNIVIMIAGYLIFLIVTVMHIPYWRKKYGSELLRDKDELKYMIHIIFSLFVLIMFFNMRGLLNG